MLRPGYVAVLVAGVGVVGCSALPSGPSAVAQPGTGRSVEAFRADDALCRAFARQQVAALAADDDAAAAVRQRRYDITYEECMYGQGHRVPADGSFAGESRPRPGDYPAYPPPPPPPPPGYRR